MSINTTDNDDSFKFASSLIKIIAVIIGLMVLIISRFAFIVFSAAMMPTIITVFFDRNEHKCLSATVCSFNLIGAIPFLMQLWDSNSIDYSSKKMLSDMTMWTIIYGAALIGQLIYISLPIVIVKLYSSKVQVNINILKSKHKKICDEWGIEVK